MTKYLIKRILSGLLSAIAVVAIVMVLIYSLLDRVQVFVADPQYSKLGGNQKEVYMYRKWEEYGYLDYVPYVDYINELVKNGELDPELKSKAAAVGYTAEKDNEVAKEYIAKFAEYYESRGYTVVRLDAKLKNKRPIQGFGQQYYAYKDKSLITRMLDYFASIVTVDNIHYVDQDVDIGERGLTFTLYDPAYGGEKFSPAIMANGTKHKYLLYFSDSFPFIHQNIITISLGKSTAINMGVDVFDTMTMTQGTITPSMMTFPGGQVEPERPEDLHTATYMLGSRELSDFNKDHYLDDYTNCTPVLNNFSRMGFSFIIGILAVVLAYLLGVPIGIGMALRKDKLLDKLGTGYIIFILAVPSLAYIFLFRAIGMGIGLPTTFNVQEPTATMYILPIVSLALPSIANLMKWLRRYMIDQMNSDYVKFARSGGLSDGEIFTKHIFKNAAIPIIHGIPADILFAMVGAIITERVYVVPGTGNMLTNAINKYDNAVIVGVTLFYAILSIVSLIAGDILMAAVDPRISFSSKER